MEITFSGKGCWRKQLLCSRRYHVIICLVELKKILEPQSKLCRIIFSINASPFPIRSPRLQPLNYGGWVQKQQLFLLSESKSNWNRILPLFCLVLYVIGIIKHLWWLFLSYSRIEDCLPWEPSNFLTMSW